MRARPMTSYGTALAFALLYITAGDIAAAQPRDRAAADTLFQAGRDAASRDDFSTACQRFEESNRLDPAVGTVLNLANCREKLGQTASAWQRYREALEKLPAADQRVALATERAKALEPRVPYLTLELADASARDVTVLRDGVELGRASLGLALPVDPGDHEIVVKAAGRADSRTAVKLAERERKKVTLELGEPLPTDAASQPPSAPGEAHAADQGASAHVVTTETGSGRRTLGWVLGGVGVAGVGVSLTAGALALSKKSVVENNCVDGRCNQTGYDAGQSGHTLVLVSNVAMAVGVVGLGAGAYFLLTSSSGRETAVGQSTRRAAAAKVTVAVSPLPGGAAIAARSRF